MLVLDLLRLGVGLLLALLGSATETEDKVEGGLLLDVVVGEGATILELLSGEDETLLIRRNTLLVLDLGLHIIDCVRRLNLKGNGLPRKGFHEYLHRCSGLGFVLRKWRWKLRRLYIVQWDRPFCWAILGPKASWTRSAYVIRVLFSVKTSKFFPILKVLFDHLIKSSKSHFQNYL